MPYVSPGAADSGTGFDQRLSDLEAAGGRDSELVRDLCRLSERETAVVAGLPKGSALRKVGDRSFQVEHLLSKREREIPWTDGRMVTG